MAVNKEYLNVLPFLIPPVVLGVLGYFVGGPAIGGLGLIAGLGFDVGVSIYSFNQIDLSND